MTRQRYFASTARGLEPVLTTELRNLEVPGVRPSHGGVFFEGTPETAWRANLWLRTGQRVLLPILEIACPDYDALYEGAREVRWIDYLTPSHTLAVEAACFDSPLNHSHHAALRIKDAIVDQLRERTGVRPDVDPGDPDVRIQAYIHKETCQLSIDLSGDPLFMRRYRVRQTEAPLKETLAAAVLMMSGWNRRAPLRDPMCGSGTIAIEAALMARDMAPGRRRTFGFQRHPDFGDAEQRAWRQLLEEADARALEESPARIEASDWEPDAVEAARANARAAGVESSISFSVRDVRDLPAGEPGSYLVSNPPYGKRLGGSNQSVESLYRLIGHRLKNMPPQNVWMLSSSPGFEAALGMSARARHRLFNGAIETWLYGYRPEAPRRRR